MVSKQEHTTRSIVGFIAGMALGFIFALDLTGWFFVNPLVLLIMELTGGFFIYRITHGLMQDTRISPVVKRGYFWAISGLILAHVLNLSYIYFKEAQASFTITTLDFSDTLATGWVYMHFVFLGYIFGCIYEGIRQPIIKRRVRNYEQKLLEIAEQPK